MAAVFHGERSSAVHASGLTGVYSQHHVQQQLNQDPDESDTGSSVTSIDSGYFGSFSGVANNRHQQPVTPPYDSPSEMMCVDGVCDSSIEVMAWMEIWDYQGGAAFRAFVADDFVRDEKSLFVFFDAGIVGRDLKKALVALIELTEAPLGCSQLVICVDRAIEADEIQTLTKGLQWAGFELATLDHWAGSLDVTSEQWLFMMMEV